MFETQGENCFNWTGFEFRFKDVLSNLQLKIIIYWHPIHNLIPKNRRRSVLNFNFSFFTYLSLMSCLMSIEQKLSPGKVTIFQLQSTSNAITCIDKRFVVNNTGISCLALIFNLRNPKTTILLQCRNDNPVGAKNWFKVARYDESNTVSPL